MRVRSGASASVPVSFASGYPDANVTWSVLGPTGAVLATDVIDPPADAVSVNIPLTSLVNTLDPGQLISFRDVEWTYEVDGAVVNGETRYSVEARVPLGASPDGVRAMLGVSASELPDDDIPLIDAYIAMIDLVTEPAFATALDGGAVDLAVRKAIEAAAALMVLPTMPVRIANSESSGTNTFKRQEIDWMVLGDALTGLYHAGILLIVPSFDPTGGFGALLVLASPATDPITGATATG